MLWTEKYRPKNSEDLIISDYHKSLLNSTSPHLLLYGPPGTGKTTYAHLLPGEKKELNASDDRGIAFIRGTLKDLAGTRKTIILDECEMLTTDAQHCLRRIIEDSPCRFVFITNYISKIIPALRSRLLKLKFEQKLDYSVLKKIGEKENLRRDDQWYLNVFKENEGDLRKCINWMQITSPLSLEEIDFIKVKIPEDVVQRFIDVNQNDVEETINEFIKESYSVTQLFKQLEIKKDKFENNDVEMKMIIAKLDAESRGGVSVYILLMNLCCNIIKLRVNK